MSYNKKVWKSGDRITKEALNNMENGIEAAHQNSGGSGTSYDDTEIKTDINTIKTDLGTEELTTTAKTVKGAVNEVAAQYKDIAKKVNDIKSSSLINQNGGGLLKIWAGTKVEYDALLVKNEDTVYLVEGSGGGSTTVTTYTITNNLTYCTNTNNSTSINENDSYSATITPDTNYKLSNATITMGGTDITNTAYNNGTIFIEHITGDVIITAEAILTAGSDTDVYDLSNYAVSTGKYISNDTGEFISGVGGTYCYINAYIELQETASNIQVCIRPKYASQEIFIGQYDSKKAFINRQKISVTATNATINLDSNTKFIRMSVHDTDNVSGFKILTMKINNKAVKFTNKALMDAPDKLTYQIGKSIDISTGAEIADSKKALTDYISVDYKNIEIFSSKYFVIRQYNATKKILSVTDTLSTNKKIDLNTQTQYIRMIIGNEASASTDIVDGDINGNEINIETDNCITRYILSNG